MKNYLRLICLVAFPILSYGQTKSLNYQAVIMDPKPIEIPGTSITGQPLKNGKVNVRFTLLSKSGSVDYEEFHQATTDEYGLINLTIGNGLIGSASGLSTQATTATYRTFDAIKWDANVKQLRVDLSFDGGKNFSTASVQPFNYTAYALYAESVEYKNVRDTPTTLSYFNNDVGYIVNKDLDPIKNEIDQNQKDAISKFLIINQAISDNEKVTADNSKKIGDISVTVNNQGTKIEQQGNQITANQTYVTNQITNITNQVNDTKAKVDQVANTYENAGNKSNSVIDDRLSSNKYPSVKAVKDYVDQATQGIALQATVDAKEDRLNKSSNIKTDPNPNVNYPSVSAVKQFVLESALSKDTQLVIDGKENVSNKSADVITDANSDSKYPTVKAIKEYVDNNTLGKNLNAVINGKEEVNNKVVSITKDNANAEKYPSVLAVKNYVDAATINSLTSEVQTISINDAKNVITLSGGATETSVTLPNATNLISGSIQLKNDLGGTYDNPTVPGLLNKENVSNKTSDFVNDGGSNDKYPTIKAVKDYVDARSTSGSDSLASEIVRAKAVELLKEDVINKTSDFVKDGGSTIKYPTIKSVKDYVDSRSTSGADSLASEIARAKAEELKKEDVINKTSDFVKDGGSTTKYPTIKSVKDYVDSRSTSGADSLASEIARAKAEELKKEDVINKTSDFVKDGGSTTKYPTIKSVKDYVDSRSTSGSDSLAAEIARAKSEELKKEDIINKTSDLIKYANSEVKYPTVKSVKDYIDSRSTSGSDSLAAEIARAKSEELKKEVLANKSTDVVTDKDSDEKYPTVKSVKTYVDGKSNAGLDSLYAEVRRAKSEELKKEVLANKSTDVDTDKDSDEKYPTVKSVKTYVDGKSNAGLDSLYAEVRRAKAEELKKEVLANKSTDVDTDKDSDEKYPTVKSVKTYVDGKSNAGLDSLYAEVRRAKAEELKKEVLANKSTDVATDKDSDEKYPTVKSVKTYVDGKSNAGLDSLYAEVRRAKAEELKKEVLANKSTDVATDKDSDEKYPTVKSVATYVKSLVDTRGDANHDEVEKEKNRAIGREDGLGNEIADNKKASDDKDAAHEKSIADNKKAGDDKDAEHDRVIADNKKASDDKDAAHEKSIADNKKAGDDKDAEHDRVIADNKKASDDKDAAHEKSIADNKKAGDDKDAEHDRVIADNKKASDDKDAAHEKSIADNKKAGDDKDAEHDRVIADNKK
ncbi:hypothetical protein, partial [Aquirufa sp. TARAVU-A1A]